MIAPVGAGRRSIAAAPERGVWPPADGDEDEDVVDAVFIAGVVGDKASFEEPRPKAVGDRAFDGVTVFGLMGAEK